MDGLRFLAQGEGGEPLVLLHGFGGDLNNWLFNAEPLSAGRAVYALDFPGHGGSVKEARDLLDALRSFLDSQGIERAHLAGHSMGGLVAGCVRGGRARPGAVADADRARGAGARDRRGLHRRVRRRGFAQGAQAGAAASCSPTPGW